MKCPNCDVDLLMAERQGVGIDYCPQCRGVWLERGKLDTIVDRGVSQALGADAAERSQAPVAADHGRAREDERRPRGQEPYGDHREGHRDEEYRRDVEDQPRRKKKGSLLGDLMGGFGGD